MLQISKTEAWHSDIYRTAGPVRWAGRTPGLYLSLLGRFCSTGRFVYQQVAPGYAIHVVQSGHGVMATKTKPYEVGPGDVFCFFPGHHYAYHDAPTTPWRYTWLVLEGSQVPKALRQVGLTADQPHLRGCLAWGGANGRNGGEGAELFAEIQQVYRRPVIPAAYAIAAGWRLIDALSRQAGPEPGVPHGAAEAARFLIDRHGLEVLTVEELARQLGLSRSALFRQFRAAYGISPKQHLDAVRLERACALLRQSAAPLKQIAAACGYTSSQYFIRAFRRHCGQAPGTWRRVHPAG
ncbi:MAG: AraC family transcriptional regulator [Phycisphaerae bacterium]